jgi:hypothetical protein
LLWLPTLPGQKKKVHKHRKLADGSVPADDLSDASLYLSRELASHTFRAAPQRPTALARDEAAAEAAAERQAQQRRGGTQMGPYDDDEWEMVSMR